MRAPLAPAVAERNGSAVDIHLGAVELELAHTGLWLDGECPFSSTGRAVTPSGRLGRALRVAGMGRVPCSSDRHGPARGNTTWPAAESQVGESPGAGHG